MLSVAQDSSIPCEKLEVGSSNLFSSAVNAVIFELAFKYVECPADSCLAGALLFVCGILSGENWSEVVFSRSGIENGIDNEVALVLFPRLVGVSVTVLISERSQD